MWGIYAMGGGWGHLTRALALARVAPVAVRIASNSPYVRLIPDQSLFAPLAALANCGVLIVDTFPRGIVGELAPCLSQTQAKKIFIARDIDPEYVQSFALHEF